MMHEPLFSTPAGKPRTGAAFLADLARNPRQVIYEGEVVRDVTTHPAFRAAACSIARLYDIAADPALRERMTFAMPGNGERALRCYQIPRSVEDLRARRAFSQEWAEATFGLMGRTPDHVASFLAGFMANLEVFAAGGAERAQALSDFYHHACRHHAYLSYAIVPPQIDRSKPAHKQVDPHLYAGVVQERPDGLVLSGAQQLATGAVFSDYVYVSCIHPLQPGDENYAFGVVIPAGAPGVKLYARRSFADHGCDARDYPLSSRFDETDSLLVLDRVFVPWKHVFIDRNLEVCRNQWWVCPSHSYGNYQAQVRYSTKLRFLLGLAKRLVEITGSDALPPVQVMLGELASLATIVDSMVDAQEAQATMDPAGFLWPSKRALYAVMSLQGEINPRTIDIVRELAGGSMIMLPASMRDFDMPAVAEDLERFIASPGVTSTERVQLLKMAWDLVGTEFAGRHQQYEKFYGGASFLVRQNMARAYDFGASKLLVERALNGLAKEEPKAAAPVKPASFGQAREMVS